MVKGLEYVRKANMALPISLQVWYAYLKTVIVVPRNKIRPRSRSVPFADPYELH